MRFSTVGGESGSADTARDPRGFAIKLRTEEGNLDWVFNNTPVFFIRDPAKFPHFIHTQKRDPQTHLKDADMFWVSDMSIRGIVLCARCSTAMVVSVDRDEMRKTMRD